MSPRWIAGQLLASNLDLNGAIEAQREYASATWARAGVVRYEIGPRFLAHDLACGVELGLVALEFPIDTLTGFNVFPDLDDRRDSLISQEAIQFRTQYQLGNTPVVGVFPWLGRYDALGALRRDPDALGSTPGVLDTRAQGVIILAYDAIGQGGYRHVLAHEMVHLLTGRAHEGPAFVAWDAFLTVFSRRFATNKPVWNGRSGSEAGIMYRDWSETLLTLASVKDGSFVYDQCAEGRSSSWLW